jgi:hypothetical protein
MFFSGIFSTSGSRIERGSSGKFRESSILSSRRCNAVMIFLSEHWPRRTTLPLCCWKFYSQSYRGCESQG